MTSDNETPLFGERTAEPSWPPPAPGTLIGKHHRVLGTIGQGGMGMVLLAYDERLARQVAIKLIRPTIVQDEETRSRFLNEARAMARVRHEAVVAVYTFGEHEGQPFFVMEYVPGTSLEAHLNKQRELLRIDEAIGILERVCRGVQSIHDTGAIHGDLKPANILIGPAFRVCVADFGLALDWNVEQHSSLGTPAYLAPERVRGDRVDRAVMPLADVYSLGVLAFELLAGELPFDADDTARIMMQHLHKAVPKISERRPELPTVFDQVIARALAKDPKERTASADQLREELLTARDAYRPPTPGKRVLVVDDDADFRALVRACIESGLPGAMIIEAESGISALTAVMESTFDLAVIDLHMPQMNGVELTANLRAVPNGKDLPILVVTGYGGASDWQVLSQLGADGFIVKPVEPESLVATARRLVIAD